MRTRHLPHWYPLLAMLFAVALVAGACGGGDDSDGGTGADKDNATEEAAGDPVYGGSATYGIEADPTGGAGTFCLPEAQLAISGMVAARMFYDTLTIPNKDGGYSPFLAESVTSDPTATVWTIKLREGITFHNGTKLDATVVKNNMDAWRGKYPARSPLLFMFVTENIADVAVADPMTVTVTTKTPWVSFPAFLWFSARPGIMAQEQLDATDCNLRVIGTGPFQVAPGKALDYVANDHISGVRNPNYWFRDANHNNNQLPYLDSLTLKVVTEGAQRVNGLQSGDLDIVHVSGGKEIEDLRAFKADGTKQTVESEEAGEVAYAMLNAGAEPFNNVNARLAVAYGLDRQAIIDKSEDGVPSLASGPFTKGNMGYLEDTGFPKQNLDTAKQYLQKYEQETGKKLSVTIGHTSDQGNTNLAKLVQEQAQKLGVTVNLQPVDQGQLINTAIKGEFQAFLWRSHPGGDPDTQYIWWHSGSVVNFSKINDPEIDSLLEQGRKELDESKRPALYEELNREFAKEAYNIWTWWTLWTVGFDKKVHGIFGPTLPDGSSPATSLATSHFLGGLWKDQ